MMLSIAYKSSVKLISLRVKNRWSWLPEEIESGNSYPAELLDTPYGDEYWLFGWLCFELMYVRAV